MKWRNFDSSVSKKCHVEKVIFKDSQEVIMVDYLEKRTVTGQHYCTL